MLYVPLLVSPHSACAGEKDKAGLAAASAKAGPVLPDPDKIVLLIRTSLLTVNDAVQTGNFTVLRDKAAPSFRDGTTSASLAKSLESLAQQRIDLSAVAIIAPQLTDLPLLDAEAPPQAERLLPGPARGHRLRPHVRRGSWKLAVVRFEHRPRQVSSCVRSSRRQARLGEASAAAIR